MPITGARVRIDGAESCVRGAGVARGYLGFPRATAERFRPEPGGCGARMYRTADVVRIRLDGQLEFHGRRDRRSRSTVSESSRARSKLPWRRTRPSAMRGRAVRWRDRPRRPAAWVTATGSAPEPQELQ